MPSSDLQYDYEPALFVEKIPDTWICSICTNVVNQPLNIPCGHLLCRECFEMMPRPRRCPNCRQDISDHLDMCHSVIAMISSSMIRCPHFSEGCKAQMVMGKDNRNLLSHLKECEYEPVSCPGCMQLVPQMRLEEHRTKDCIHRVVSCRHCGSFIKQQDVTRHELQGEANSKRNADGSPAVIDGLIYPLLPCGGMIYCSNACSVTTTEETSKAADQEDLSTTAPMCDTKTSDDAVENSSLPQCPSSQRLLEVTVIKKFHEGKHKLLCPKEMVFCRTCALNLPRSELHTHLSNNLVGHWEHIQRSQVQILSRVQELERIFGINNLETSTTISSSAIPKNDPEPQMSGRLVRASSSFNNLSSLSRSVLPSYGAPLPDGVVSNIKLRVGQLSKMSDSFIELSKAAEFRNMAFKLYVSRRSQFDDVRQEDVLDRKAYVIGMLYSAGTLPSAMCIWEIWLQRFGTVSSVLIDRYQTTFSSHSKGIGKNFTIGELRRFGVYQPIEDEIVITVKLNVRI